MKVLVFHKVNNQINFEKILGYLKENYEIVGIEYFEKDYPISFIKNKKEPLIITFDDGDLSVYQNAYPILKHFNLPALLFVITGLINTEKPFWWDELEYYLGSTLGNKKTWEVKGWPNGDREKFLAQVRKESNKPPLLQRQLQVSELIEMHNHGISIANHSHTHPMFDQCTPTEIQNEIRESRSFLDSVGLNGEFFAYPNGNFSELTERILVQEGIKYSFLFDHQINKGNLNPLRISRLIVNDTTPLWKLKFILSGWHKKLLPLTRRIGKIIG